jgi:UDP-3-O-[3-hydroxymyristoyl] N-acetylglucosamine deacetylase
MQTTIAQPIRARGVGIHSGNDVTVSLAPAEADEGIGFIRADLGDAIRIPAHFSRVHHTVLATSLRENGHEVQTVEHLMACFSALGIDNVTVTLDGPEIPIMDGSARPLAALLDEAGIKALDAGRRIARVTETVMVKSGDATATLAPREDDGDGLELDYTIVYDNPHIGTQRFASPVNPDTFRSEIAPARTFGLVSDISMLFEMGKGMGGSFETAVIIGDEGVLNPDGLRFPDECVRHKCLDAVGDLALFGMPLFGQYIAHKAGHRLNLGLLEEFSKRGAYEIVMI